jgi:hypothetical protein
VKNDLSNVALVDLVEEIRRRSLVSLVALRLDGGSPEADIRILMHSRDGHSLDLAGISALAHKDVMEACSRSLMVERGPL